DASVAYAKEREQFGRPIASFQLVQQMLADMVVDTQAARGLVWQAGWLKDSGKPNTAETSIAKLFATEAAVRSANSAIQVHGGSGRLNRPDARNALSAEVMSALGEIVEAWDADPDVGAIVIAGGDEYFAAGADIKAMRDRDFQAALTTQSADFWPRIARCRTPLIAAVSGFALGGGCELALLCDMIVASETAELGQPEIRLGIIPGGGGTQRLARVLGKQRAMELVLTGRRIDAHEAHRIGLVNRVAGD